MAEQRNFCPSIGEVGHLAPDQGNDRLKGFLIEPISDINGLLGGVRQIDQNPKAAEVSGIFWRVFCKDGFTPDEVNNYLAQNGILAGGKTVQMVGIIPLPSNAEELDNIAYFGASSEQRKSSPALIQAETDLLKKAQASAQEKRPPALPEGFFIEIVSPESYGNLTDGDFSQITAIYAKVFEHYAFPLTLERVKQMLYSSAVGLARDPKGNIVSLTMAEIAPQLHGLKMAELSDAATDPDLKNSYPGVSNINYWVGKALIRNLVKEGIDVIYAESRADLFPVLRKNFWLGMEPTGFLPQVCQMKSSVTSLSSALTQSQYGDLVVMTLPPAQIQRIREELNA